MKTIDDWEAEWACLECEGTDDNARTALRDMQRDAWLSGRDAAISHIVKAFKAMPVVALAIKDRGEGTPVPEDL